MTGGYTGKILRANLTDETFKIDPLPKDWIREYIGGDGFAAKLLYEEVAARIDPLSERNKLIIATGPITGTLWPMSGRTVFVSKAAQTGIWGESHVGGFLGPELKYAGYDMLVVEGKAEDPVYLLIQDGHLQIHSAKDFWGMTTDKVTTAIQKKHNDPDIQIAAIGPAGENLIRFSAVIINHARAAGRTGMGAVLGSKNMKAIAIRGTGSVEVADHEGFLELAKEAHDRLRNNPQAKEMGKWGTWILTAVKQQIGELPTYNHRTGVFPGWEKLSADYIRPRYTVSDRACFGCSLGCKKLNYVSHGPYAGTLEEGPEYEGLMAFGSALGIADYPTTLKANQICNKYGMDIISAGSTIGFAIESFEGGAIDEETTGGLKLEWGNSDLAIKLLELIGKREGFGDILAEGTRRAAEILGPETEPFALHVKGLEFSGQDGRTHRSIGLGHATGARGADHLRSLVTVDQLGYQDVAAERWGADKLPEIVDPYTETHKAVAVFETENTYAIRDTMIVCWYSVSWPPVFWMRDFANILPLATGEKSLGDVENLTKIAERQVTLKRLFNTREGISRADDRLPPRFTDEPMPEGPGKGQTVNLEPMLDDYYNLRGWDLETGLPTSKTISRLSLDWAVTNK
ncbi:MAG: aldehyde ferredoxin oxidoreductase family protein [Candidatus Thorarchaeota archaeon]|nr:MAG: aldehyde ferredoxin oxidoreductase family protein [Candidatus Thorarchaeota archaeon]